MTLGSSTSSSDAFSSDIGTRVWSLTRLPRVMGRRLRCRDFAGSLPVAWYPVLRVTRGVKRGSACVLVAMLALATAGCGAPKPLDPTSDTIAPQKKAAVESLLQGARAAADQFGAGDALNVGEANQFALSWVPYCGGLAESSRYGATICGWQGV